MNERRETLFGRVRREPRHRRSAGRRAQGATHADFARSYHVGKSTISRLSRGPSKRSGASYMSTTTDGKSKRKSKKPWWKIQEEVSFLFKKLFRPLEREILHGTRQRDIVGVLRQLDVGVIDSGIVHNRVKSLVEVQKRQSKVGIEDFGSWIYKRNTLQADELIIISQEGFTRSVIAHAKRENVKLGMLRQVETGFIQQIDSTVLGATRVWDKWWFASIFVQYGKTCTILWLSNLNRIMKRKFLGRPRPWI